MYRVLTLGDAGTDVVWLNDALAQLGYFDASASDRSVVSIASLDAVAAMATDLGVFERPDTFDPGWFVWLPSDPYEVTGVAMIAGAPAPPAGSEVASTAMLLTGLSLQRLEGGPLTLDPGTEYVLNLADVEVTLGSESATLVGADLDRISSNLDPSADSVAGTVYRAQPTPVWPVPSSAVISGTDGHLCIWTEGSEGYVPLTVQVVAARAGVTFVEPPASARVRVLQNPAQILPEPACPSV